MNETSKTLLIGGSIIVSGLVAWLLLAEKKMPEPPEFRHVESPPATYS